MLPIFAAFLIHLLDRIRLHVSIMSLDEQNIMYLPGVGPRTRSRADRSDDADQVPVVEGRGLVAVTPVGPGVGKTQDPGRPHPARGGAVGRALLRGGGIGHPRGGAVGDGLPRSGGLAVNALGHDSSSPAPGGALYLSLPVG